MRARVATAFIGVPLLIAVVFFGHVWHLFTIVVFLVTVGALAEYFRMAFPGEPKERLLGTFLGALLSLSILLPDLVEPGLVLAGTIIAGFCSYLFFSGSLDFRYRRLGWMLLGILYLGYLFPHLGVVYNTPDGSRWIAFILLVVAAGDTAAYFTGMALGRRKLYPEVSPGKTVEGAIGGGLASVVGGLWAAAVLLPRLNWWEAVLVAGVAGLFAQTGDLFESWIKRVFGAKDSGRLLPGHGGLLDRIDSIIFPAVLLAYYVKLAHL